MRRSVATELLFESDAYRSASQRLHRRPEAAYPPAGVTRAIRLRPLRVSPGDTVPGEVKPEANPGALGANPGEEIERNREVYQAPQRADQVRNLPGESVVSKIQNFNLGQAGDRVGDMTHQGVVAHVKDFNLREHSYRFRYASG